MPEEARQGEAPRPLRGRDQAEALAAAMAEVAARHGYGGASVARVLKRAGVSRQVFYRHYAGREECFLAAYRHAAAQIGGRLREAARRGGVADRPEAALAALLRAAEERPAAARMIFVEALGACAAVHAEHERQLGGIERSIERFLRLPGAPALRVPPAALLGGVAGVISARILRGEAGGGEDLLAGLRAWMRSYESADARPGPLPLPRRPTPGGRCGRPRSSCCRAGAAPCRRRSRAAPARRGSWPRRCARPPPAATRT